MAFVACGEASVSGNESATSVSESVGQEDENAEKPTYSGTNKLRIGMWSGIPTEIDGKKLTDEELLGYYRDLAASGITIASSAILYNSKEYNLRRRRRGRYKTVDTGQRRDERFVRRKRRSGRQRAEKE